MKTKLHSPASLHSSFRKQWKVCFLILSSKMGTLAIIVIHQQKLLGKQAIPIAPLRGADGDTWTWQNGDAINLYVMGYGSISPTTTTLTYINGRWSTFNVTLPATVEACYPATATLTSFTIPTNQSAGIAEADYMTTASSQQLNGTNLSLALEHRLSKVIVTITDWSDYGSTMPTVTDFKIQTKESITVNGSTVTGDGNTIDISPLQDEAAHSYTAIVAPGTGFTITLTVDRRSKTVTSAVWRKAKPTCNYPPSSASPQPWASCSGSM